MNNSSDICAEKEKIRHTMKNIRSGLRKPEDTVAGLKILRRILALPGLWDSAPSSAMIGLYFPVRMEADLLSYANILLTEGFRIALPRVSGNSLVFAQIRAQDDLCTGMFGIREPMQDTCAAADKDLYAICVPGLAFDRTGARLGYGKGYYDQFITSQDLPVCPILIGVGYDFQLLESVPKEAHDLQLDYIVTPTVSIETCSSDFR